MKINIPSSQGGLNLKDSLDAMEPQYAIQMDNVIPDTNRDVLRGGYVPFLNRSADCLMAHREKGFETLLFASEGSVYAVGLDTVPELGSGFSSNDWQYSSFTDGSGKVNTILTNGIDNVQRVYEDNNALTMGAAYTSATSLICPCTFKNRMYFAHRDTLKICYSDSQAIAGELTDFDLGSLFKFGGSIVSLANWTQDAGTGMDDLLCIFTSEGEVAVYSGTSPEAQDWSLNGVFRISKPIGLNSTCKIGGDLVIITQGGYFPLSEVLSQDRANRCNISDKINPIVIGKDFNANWEAVWYAKKGWLVINAPSTNTGYAYEQHVLNTKTGGWCRFVGMNALSWLELQDNLYFCNSSGIFQADYGETDNGEKITYYLQKAYSQYDMQEVKQVLLVKERNLTLGQEYIGTRIGVDFALQDPKAQLVPLMGTQSMWDVAIWDKSFWSDERPITQMKSPIFSTFGNFISVGILGQSATALEFYGLEAKIKVGNGDVW
jgi:hypothetical protein